MNRIILLVDSFPYGIGENFLETELMFCKNKVDIFLYQTIKNETPVWAYKDNIKIHKRPLKYKNRIIRLLKYSFSIFHIEVLREIIFCFKKKKLNLKTLRKLLYFYIDGIEYYKWVLKECSSFNETVKIYSYWMFIQAFAGAMLSKKLKNDVVITRCHGFDIYEERHLSNYIPFRKFILTNTDIICPVSLQGVNYLKKQHYIKDDNKFRVAKLGTINNLPMLSALLNKKASQRNVLKIVSCSSLVPVKRIHLLISSLSDIDDIQIEWSHIGSGYLQKDLETSAMSLPKNIIYKFYGQLSKKEIDQLYFISNFHVFVNVSESEGIPVSIMEACSYYIPIIATDVGGVSEIVKDQKNGFLLDKDFKNNDLIDKIKKITSIKSCEYINICLNSRSVWENEYNAATNYDNFYYMINYYIKDR